MNIPRLAYCSPFNPVASGISDYSEELLAYLCQYGDIVLYHNSDTPPNSDTLRQHFAVHPLRRLPHDHRRRPFDALIYHLGNSPAHSEIWHMAQRLPGVIVLHDLVLHHFMLSYYARHLRDIRGYVAMMEQTYGAAGVHVAQLMIRGRFTDAAFDFPCNEPVLRAARAMIVHSQYAARHIAAQCPDLPVAMVPMGVPLPPHIAPTEARARLGLPQDALILASFGHINAYKRLEPTLRALHHLLPAMPHLRYLLVGSISPNYNVRGLIERLGLEAVVQVTGFVERGAFDAYVAAADICINLRHPTAGETSASLLRLLGAGRATLVSRTGAFAELPAHVAVQIDPDDSEGEQLVAALRLLAQQPALAHSIGSHARTYVADQHTLDQAAMGYARFLARIGGWQQVARYRPPLPLPVAPAPTAPPPAPSQHTLALLPKPAILATVPLVQHTAQALAELGISADDTLILPRVAQALTDVAGSLLEDTEI